MYKCTKQKQIKNVYDSTATLVDKKVMMTTRMDTKTETKNKSKKQTKRITTFLNNKGVI